MEILNREPSVLVEIMDRKNDFFTNSQDTDKIWEDRFHQIVFSKLSLSEVKVEYVSTKNKMKCKEHKVVSDAKHFSVQEPLPVMIANK